MNKSHRNKIYDLICVGGGIMSMTYALMLKILKPEFEILILERLSETGQESSKTMNNAGTGHSGNCELNYTLVEDNGHVDISKALDVCHDFELTKQFWSYLIEEDFISNPDSFVFPTSHCSWVHDEEQVKLLKKRFEKMKASVEFENMEYTEDFDSMRDWFPVIMRNRDDNEHLAGTRIKQGTEIDFEAVTKSFMNILKNEFDVDILVDHDVKDVNRTHRGWTVDGKTASDEKSFSFETEKIFIGAGGGALLLLQKSEIEQHSHYGGFPVSGKWLVCRNEELIKNHDAQVYSKASGNNPPMSAPHLDSRHIDGKKALMFGPFAGFSTKFLKEGSSLDLPHSINFENIPTYWGVFWKNLDLTRYLVEQVVTGKDAQLEELRKFVKDAKSEDWEMQNAGQRVQILKKSKEEGALLEFGTEVVSNKDGTVTALLGASPGASTAVKIALDIIKQEYPDLLNSDEVKTKLNHMIPFWDKPVEGNEDEFRKIREQCHEKLGLKVSAE
ncbi:malate:quinone oxidoreductase [Psychroflexus sp. CAK1W]|uniref:malate:quinone oxidoreductase n=1 Tax=Psychroflexus curvus TaxID=2873595 RepID=UPI001CCDCE59|nr:malate:quinone oxidoreductase [Psychroflexus curvus]MBZ9627917.1 malate:quinone oxidoreductase [Psychroflexus curvus]